VNAELPNATIIRFDPRLDELIDPAAPFTKLADGFNWSEGPVWVEEGQYLLFSDVPGNRIHKWAAANGLSTWLDPSGGDGPAKPGFREPGTNGLKPGMAGEIIAADHGSRAVAVINLETKVKRLLATGYEGRKFNSPNDIAVAPDGAIWFTDPPYGLEGLNQSPLREQVINGVYRLDPDGSVTLTEGGLTFPNGLVFSPDGGTLYVAVSDPRRAIIIAFRVTSEATLASSRIFSDMTAMTGPDNPGLPDGMTVDELGNVWATGPGGVHIFTPDGERVGTVRTGTAVSNLAFGGTDGRTLFLTSHHMLVSLPTKVRGSRRNLPSMRSATQG
jgi:gluconolactonase